MSTQPVVLCVEDNPANRVLIEILIEPHDVRLVIARTGAEAKRLAKSMQPDLILLDLHLPDCTGHDVLAEIRRDDDTSRTPVAILTADLAVDDATFADDTLTMLLRKPIERASFNAVISTYACEEASTDGPRERTGRA